MRNKTNITRHEVIGLRARVVQSRNPANLHIEGKIVDETTHTLVIEQNKKDKRVFKKCVGIEVVLDNENILINGADLVGRPWDRIKNKNGNN